MITEPEIPHRAATAPQRRADFLRLFNGQSRSLSGVRLIEDPQGEYAHRLCTVSGTRRPHLSVPTLKNTEELP